MIRRFKNDPYFLSRYYLISSMVFLILIIASLFFLDHDYSPSIYYWIGALVPLIISSFMGVVISSVVNIIFFAYFRPDEITSSCLLLIPLGIYIGALNVPLIHNCAHNLFRPKFFNRLFGELLSVHLMSGFPGFAFLHLRHHQFADTENDPHPNRDYTFWEYLNSLKKNLNSAYRKNYFEQWGDSARTRKHWKIFTTLVPVGRVLRSLMIMSVLGPKIFVFFYVPSFIANQLTYAHINYYTHHKDADGTIEIINMDKGVWKFFNFILIGIYSHKNHHENPGLFNPSL